MKEEWKVIEGFDGYQISNLGRLKSLKKSGEKILKTRINSKGYLVSTIYNKKMLVQSIHQLVAIAFLEHKVDGHKKVVDHINNNKLDNRIENLQIITQRENSSKDVKKLSSKYIGITYHKKSQKWHSRILINKIRVNLGFYNTQEEASKVYQNNLKDLPSLIDKINNRFFDENFLKIISNIKYNEVIYTNNIIDYVDYSYKEFFVKLRKYCLDNNIQVIKDRDAKGRNFKLINKY